MLLVLVVRLCTMIGSVRLLHETTGLRGGRRVIRLLLVVGLGLVLHGLSWTAFYCLIMVLLHLLQCHASKVFLFKSLELSLSSH